MTNSETKRKRKSRRRSLDLKPTHQDFHDYTTKENHIISHKNTCDCGKHCDCDWYTLNQWIRYWYTTLISFHLWAISLGISAMVVCYLFW